MRCSTQNASLNILNGTAREFSIETVTYYPDLSPYEFLPDRAPVLNVG